MQNGTDCVIFHLRRLSGGSNGISRVLVPLCTLKFLARCRDLENIGLIVFVEWL